MSAEHTSGGAHPELWGSDTSRNEIRLGETFTIRVEAGNRGSAAEWQTLQISFPEAHSQLPITIVEDSGGSASIYRPGDGRDIHYGYGSCCMEASDPLVEMVLDSFSYDGVYLEVEVKPIREGPFTFAYKTVAGDADGHLTYAPTSGWVDGQGEYARLHKDAVMVRGGAPDPDVVGSADAPTAINMGDWADVRVEADNDGDDTSEWQTVSIAFPDPIDGVRVIDHDLDRVDVFQPGDRLNCGYGTSMCTLAYINVEGTTSGWDPDDEHGLTVQVKPADPGPFTFYYKTVAGAGGEVYADPTSGTRDQQDEYVYTRTIEVRPGGDPDIVDASVEGLPVAPGGSVTARYFVDNPRAEDVEAWLGMSIRSTDGTILSDPSHDAKVVLPAGRQSTFDRTFQVPADADPGTYEWVVAAWPDAFQSAPWDRHGWHEGFTVKEPTSQPPEQMEEDSDRDGTPDDRDNCPHRANDQSDRDGDGVGDACDTDPPRFIETTPPTRRPTLDVSEPHHFEIHFERGSAPIEAWQWSHRDANGRWTEKTPFENAEDWTSANSWLDQTFHQTGAHQIRFRAWDTEGRTAEHVWDVSVTDPDDPGTVEPTPTPPPQPEPAFRSPEPWTVLGGPIELTDGGVPVTAYRVGRDDGVADRGYVFERGGRIVTDPETHLRLTVAAHVMDYFDRHRSSHLEQYGGYVDALRSAESGYRGIELLDAVTDWGVTGITVVIGCVVTAGGCIVGVGIAVGFEILLELEQMLLSDPIYDLVRDWSKSTDERAEAFAGDVGAQWVDAAIQQGDLAVLMLQESKFSEANEAQRFWDAYGGSLSQGMAGLDLRELQAPTGSQRVIDGIIQVTDAYRKSPAPVEAFTGPALDLFYAIREWPGFVEALDRRQTLLDEVNAPVYRQAKEGALVVAALTNAYPVPPEASMIAVEEDSAPGAMVGAGTSADGTKDITIDVRPSEVAIEIDSRTHDGDYVVIPLGADAARYLDNPRTEVLVDGVRIRKAWDVGDVRNPFDDDGKPEYLLVDGAGGTSLYVSFPHFSLRQVVLREGAPPPESVLTPAPGSVAAVGLILLFGLLARRRADRAPHP